jgi:hypothetical protein
MSEEPLHIWRPSLRAFGLRCIGIFLLTFVMTTPIWPLFGGLAALATSFSLCLLYMFVLDDFTHWIEHRKTVWTLSPSKLTYENPQEDIAQHLLPLSEIVAVKPRFFWDIQLRLTNGTAITMHYIDRPRSVCPIIETAIAQEAQS